MSEMVERVAVAISNAQMAWKAANGGDDASVVDCPDEVLARAAIEAMREPTDQMVGAANRNNHPRDVDTWRTMIDEALK
jgi:hypothetical protein